MIKEINKSISELEKWKWKGEIPTRGTHSGTECRFYELHNIALSKLDLSDIRFLIGQNSGLEYLVPYAIGILEEDLFIEVEYYQGDLFCALALINNVPNYWSIHRKEQQQLLNFYSEQKRNIGTIEEYDIIQKIKEAYEEFLGR